MPTIQKIYKFGSGSFHLTIPIDVIRHFEREYGITPEEIEVKVDDNYNLTVKVLPPVMSYGQKQRSDAGKKRFRG